MFGRTILRATAHCCIPTHNCSRVIRINELHQASAIRVTDPCDSLSKCCMQRFSSRLVTILNSAQRCLILLAAPAAPRQPSGLPPSLSCHSNGAPHVTHDHSGLLPPSAVPGGDPPKSALRHKQHHICCLHRPSLAPPCSCALPGPFNHSGVCLPCVEHSQRRQARSNSLRPSTPWCCQKGSSLLASGIHLL